MSAAALAWLAWQWPVPAELTHPAVTMAAPAPRVEVAAATALPVLPGRGELPLLLTQVQQIAVIQGLDWASADYKLLPASEDAPAAVEVRCNLKGPYPRLRQVMAQWLGSVPGLAIRDLAMSRPSSDAVDVEARLVLVLFMQAQGAGDSTRAGGGRP